MALIVADRVLETSTTTGTGALTLAAAITGYRRFSAVCSTNDTLYYAIVAVDTNGNPSGDWEVGLGTYSSANTLTRTTPQASTNSNNAVNFAAGTKHVFITPSAAHLALFAKLASLATIATSGSGADLTAATVTLAKIANAAASSKLLGSGASGSGAAYAELTLGTNLSMSGTTLNAAGGAGNKFLLQWAPVDNEPPTSNYATLDTRNGHPCLDFDTTTQEAAIFTGVLPSDYAGAGITVAVYCSLTSATTGTVGWLVSIERMDASSLDIDADSFASAQTITATTVPGTSGQLLKLSVNISSGANMDSAAAGEMIRVKIERDVANDTATGDAELLRVTLKEQ